MIHQFEHLIFFDDNCPLCRASVKRIIQIDKEKLFCFAPLIGETARSILKGKHKKLLNTNSLVLVENFANKNKKYWIRSKGFFRIMWLIGGIYKMLGAFYILPAFLIDWIYKMIASYRHKISKKQNNSLFKPKEKKRFLP